MERLTIPDEKIEGGMRRAIIDVREVRKEAMTVYFALKAYEDTGLTPDQIREIDQEYAKLGKEVQQYRKIGTVEECMQAREKQILKKPIRIDCCTCPSCGTYNDVIRKRRNTVAEDIVYCWHCGQAMDCKIEG